MSSAMRLIVLCVTSRYIMLRHYGRFLSNLKLNNSRLPIPSHPKEQRRAVDQVQE